MAASNETQSTWLDETGQMLGDGARAGARVLDSHGRPMRRARGDAERMSAQFGTAIRRQPIAAFAIGIGLGLVIGRLTA